MQRHTQDLLPQEQIQQVQTKLLVDDCWLLIVLQEI
jgi:hypothetical protein